MQVLIEEWTMLNLDLFAWWAISISGGIAFLVLVSVYLYSNSKSKRKESIKTSVDRGRLGKDFVFVWVLVGLLVFYIVSVNIGSAIIFAAGNITVEAILIIYLVKNRREKPEQKQRPRSPVR
jgi:cobalamin synthase